MNMRTAKVIAWLGVVAMTLALFQGFSQGDFLKDGGMILKNPWGIVSMVDLYVGFILFSMWIYFREGNPVAAVVWIAAMMIFGFFAGSLYTAINLGRSKGDWHRFFLGHRA